MQLKTNDDGKTFYLEFNENEIKHINDKGHLEFDFQNIRKLSEMFVDISIELTKRIVDIEKKIK